MRSVVIIGAGNVAFHLTRALIQNTVNVRQIFNRTLYKAQELGEANNIKYTDKISELEKADLYIIAASDSAVEELSHYIPFDDTLVVHTSGSLSTSVLKGDYRKGVFYPFQTFTKRKNLRYEEVPFFVEAENKDDEEALFKLADKISNEVYRVDSEKRLKVHLSGIWASNFVNHMYQIAQTICKEADLPFDVLRPLIEETAKKVQDLEPFDAQTGPARRGDELIINKHLEVLKDSRHQQLYRLISDSILRTYRND
ncbi:MAG: DUF2520 domain-containing protein [Flavobacteriaceae bacterium]|mgnify:CR=1 FL=1|jgi:predicted short-subunit dehydrogenase-like oxidoreductase (DUF2520 family)|nr:DUF2520 domain-containing protein [Flavobacteriaceae bacterium]